MSKFNEAEISLLRQWSDARLIENSMESVREKHTATLEKVLDVLQSKHEELNARQNLVSKGDGRLGIGKKSWTTKPNYFISGFWLGDILLDNLTSDDDDPPHKFVWVNHPEGDLDLEEAQTALCEAAKRILPKEDLRQMNSDQGQWTKGIAGISCPLVQSRAEFIELLIKDESRGFIACMVAHFQSMVGFASALDEIHKSAKRRRK